jgi:hypothetical protein
MPRHLKKTAVKPTSGMPQTRQLAASGGVWVSKDAVMQDNRFIYREEINSTAS